MLTRLITLTAAFGALATVATAQPAARGMAACRTDMATFCAGIEAGKGKRVACLIANKDKVSAACSATIQQRAAQAPAGAAAPPPGAPGSSVAPPAGQVPATPPGSQAAAPSAKGAAPAHGKGGGRLAACRVDLQVLCANVPAGGGAKMRCLQDNQAKLGPACAQTIGELKSAKQAARGACAMDAKTLCPDLKGDQRRACFTANQSKLSPECTAALGKRAAR
jgi:hypothetical protein